MERLAAGVEPGDAPMMAYKDELDFLLFREVERERLIVVLDDGAEIRESTP